MFSAEDLMIPLASMFDYEGNAPQEQRASSTRRSATVQKDYKWVRMEDSAVSDFTIQYEKGVGKKEKDFYRSKYPLLDKVMEDRIHCTSCDTHLGTAPIDEVTIRQHPVLKVTQCSKCYAFYTSGEFDKGEDGSELYCRWCGQGGEVFCCAKCPYVFCKKCIVRNLTKNTIKDIIKNENWMCFACEPEITWGLRAKHWALMNFIEKQRKIILTQYVSDGDVNFLLSRDLTSCCQKEAAPVKEAKKSVTPKAAPKPSPVLKTPQVVPQKTPVAKSAPKTRKRDTPDQVKEPPAKRARIEGEPESDIVCTPDILSMFDNSAEINPPPLTQIRQYGASTNGTPPNARTAAQKKTQTITIANQSPATPIYHTINGFRIDLNSAARQETIRLPNGKLIQVKKQSTPQQQPPMVPPLMSPAMRAVRPQMRPQIPRMPTGRPPRRQPNIMRPQVQPPTSSNQTRPLILNGMMQPQYNVPPLIISQQAANSPYGKAKMELDNRIRNGQEICMHIIGKMNTLVASNAYKSMKSVKDVKEIHIHLSYLLTYAINRFKTLQEKSMENMKTLGFGGDVDSIMSGKITASTPEEGDDNDDDIEIVEPQTTLIDLASDEEEPLKEVEETPKAKESQMFLDKLKMQPKILLKKLPGSAFAEAKADKENEQIVKDILKEIMDKVMESAAASEEGEANGEDLEIVENQKKSSEAMEVDAATISIDDEDSGDVVEVVDKVQSEEVPEEVDGEAEKTAEETEKTAEETEKEEDARDNQLNTPLEDVEMESKEGEEEKVEEKNDSEADVEMKEDTESAEVEQKEPKDQDAADETAKDDKEEVEEVKEVENPPEDVDMEKGDEDLQEKEKDPEEDDICAPDEDEDEGLKTPPSIPDLPDLPDTEGDPEEVKSPEESPKVPETEEEGPEKEPKTDEEAEEPPTDVLESPASPDPADFNKEVRAFEDIDSPDEFDDALDTPAAGADLLDDLVKPTDDFPDDLDSLGKFLDNQG